MWVIVTVTDKKKFVHIDESTGSYELLSDLDNASKFDTDYKNELDYHLKCVRDLFKEHFIAVEVPNSILNVPHKNTIHKKATLFLDD